MSAYTVARVAVDDRSDLNSLDAGGNYLLYHSLGEHHIVVRDHLAGVGVDNGTHRKASDKSVLKAFERLGGGAVGYRSDPCAVRRIALFLADYDLLRYIDQTSGEVSGVSGTKSGIGKRLTGASRTHEVLEYLHALAEVGLDRDLHRLTVGSEHRSAHTGKLTHLCH